MKNGSKMVVLRKNGISQNKRSLEDYVVSGARVFCSCGTNDICMIFPDRGYMAGCASVGLDIDVSLDRNFSGNFGSCRCTKKECAPVFSSRWVETGKRQALIGGHPLLARSMLVCKSGGVISFRDDGQNLKIQEKKFMIPEEYRKEIEAIIASERSWTEKADHIGYVYEKYLYKLYQQDFDDFSKIFGQYDRGSQEVQNAENKLGRILQKGNIDIKEVARALGDDMIRVVPKNDPFSDRLITFKNFVEPNAPADLKARPLSDAIGKDGYDFSIWSRKWKSDMRPDHLGNYLYGYNGIAYFNDFNLDDLFPSEPLLKTPWGSIGEKNILSRGIVESIRSANTDKTDAEMLLLFAAGGAQVLDDKDVVKYISSMMKGNWGDNEIDPQFVSEGVDDHYRSKGIDKSEIIRRERD